MCTGLQYCAAFATSTASSAFASTVPYDGSTVDKLRSQSVVSKDTAVVADDGGGILNKKQK